MRVCVHVRACARTCVCVFGEGHARARACVCVCVRARARDVCVRVCVLAEHSSVFLHIGRLYFSREPRTTRCHPPAVDQDDCGRSTAAW